MPTTTTADIDYWRQLDIFSPASFQKKITVIGAGATGSYVVWLLAKMGCRDIMVYDFDEVENHNLPNQLYLCHDVGRKKVDALDNIVAQGTGIAIQSKPERFQSGELSGIVFVLTDTMTSRKEIWSSSLRYKFGVDLVIETRMEAEGGRVYALCPTMPNEVDAYEQTLYDDEEAEESPCTRHAVAPTVSVLAGMAVFTLINYVNGRTYPNESIVSLFPSLVLTRQFK